MSQFRPSSFVLRPFISDTWVRFFLAPAFVFLACCLDRNYQTDLWHHLARGRVIVEEGRLLDEDRFTFTVHGQPFQDVNWLTQVVFYRVYQLGGLDLLQTVNALLMASMMAAVVALSYRSGKSMAVACGVGLFVFLGMWQLFLIRPQTVSLVLFVSLYAVLEGSEKKPWLLLLAPLHLALWVNVHGAFPIGLVLIGCYLLAAVIEGVWKNRTGVIRDGRVWMLMGCFAVSALATLANPYGWSVYEYVRHTSGIAGERRIDEWLPPGLNTLPGIALALSVAALMILLLLPGRRLNPRQAVLLAVFLCPAASSVRMVAWWLIVAAPILACLIADRWARREASNVSEQPNLGAFLTCIVMLTAIVMSLPFFDTWSPFNRIKSPHRLETDLELLSIRLRKFSATGRIFTRFEWSEYFTWELGPSFAVFMDGRIEIIPDDVWKDYGTITNGDAGWEQLLLEKYKVQFLVIDQGPYHGRLRPLVETSHQWVRDGSTEGPATIYRRQESEKK